MVKPEISKKLKSHYDGYYRKKSDWRWVGSYDKVINIVNSCNELPHNKILEIGSGEGSILKRLSEMEFAMELYALEVSKSGVRETRNKEISTLIEAKIFNGYDIPYYDNEFDLTILSHVLEQVESTRMLLYEAARVSKYVFIEIPLEDNIFSPMDFEFKPLGHINFYSQKSIKWLVQSCNCKILDQKITNPVLKTYQYRYGKKGIIRYMIKELALRITPR